MKVSLAKTKSEMPSKLNVDLSKEGATKLLGRQGTLKGRNFHPNVTPMNLENTDDTVTEHLNPQSPMFQKDPVF